MNNCFIHCLLFSVVSVSLCMAEPVQDPLTQARAEEEQLVSEISEKESSLIKYECAIHIQKAIYNLISGETENNTEESRKAMMADCLSGQNAVQQCDESALSGTAEDNSNCTSMKKSGFMDENKNRSYQELVENFTNNSDDIILFVSDIITVDPDKLSEIINKETE